MCKYSGSQLTSNQTSGVFFFWTLNTFFASWSGTRDHVVSKICNDRRSLCNTFVWMGTLQASQQFHGRVLVEVQGARPLEAPNNLYPTVPKFESNIAQQYVDCYAFFHMHCSTKPQENPKSPKFFQFSSYQKKNCMFYSSSWIIFLKFKRQAI